MLGYKSPELFEIKMAAYIDNGHGPEKQTVITFEEREHPHTALLLHSFFIL